MRIVIDMQGAQSPGSRNRGIGRYSTALTQAIIRNKGTHEVLLALNGFFADTIEPIRAEFDKLIPQENIHVWHATGPVCHLNQANAWRRKTAELTREAFLASLKPDLVYVSSLFEGWDSDAVTSIGKLTLSIPTAVTLYDLIPLINRKPYLENPAVEAWYENKIDQLRRADLLLAISESSRQEGIAWLGFPHDQSVNVGTAADPQFRRMEISSNTEQGVRTHYGLVKPFVMYTGGIDFRKNIEGLIRAFALLPASLRDAHQLAIVCAVDPHSRDRLEKLAIEHGLNNGDVILTGFVPEKDLIVLYHVCKAFVFPSWHEGFGLPALEAMSCGAPVIAANTSSLPEVVGRDDALFDPHDDSAIAAKIAHVLTDDAFRAELVLHGLVQSGKFSWEVCGQRAIAAMERVHSEKTTARPALCSSLHRPKLAYISPLPLERTGIADYSAELLPELSRHYDIDVIVAQEKVTNPWIKENCGVHDAQWLLEQNHRYDRVLYHFGNSPYHQHMFDLLQRVPGVVVMHDFYLGHIIAHMDWLRGGQNPTILTNELYCSHGYNAVRERFQSEDSSEFAWKYPSNKTIIEQACGIIVHSEYSKRLGRHWYGQGISDDWSVIPHLRVPVQGVDRGAARKALSLDKDAFVVCCFGVMGVSKQNERLLNAWLSSPLKNDRRSILVFAGENSTDRYGDALAKTILNSGRANQIKITGWLEMEQFRNYLAAADIGVQLRTHSRGETSGTVLDCMNYGLPTIVNANGSMADLPSNAVWMLQDNFDDNELIDALATLWQDGNKRHSLGARAQNVIRTLHAPRACADQYARTIESIYEQMRVQSDGNILSNAIAGIEDPPADNIEWQALAQAIAFNQHRAGHKQLLLDISVLVQSDAKSGIQRVVRSILSDLLMNPPQGYRVEPVYAIPNQKGYRYARQFSLRFLGCPAQALADEPVDVFPGDVYLGLDLAHLAVVQQSAFYEHLRRIGGHVYSIVYDLLPVMRPNAFPDGVHLLHTKWLSALAQTDGVVCISRAVADEMIEWLAMSGARRVREFSVGWFHLGADVAGSIPTTGLPSDVHQVLNTLKSRLTFLSVGTIEPRKGMTQVLAAFELLWSQDVDINLVIIGKQGWNMELLVDKLNSHPERNQRLFWLEGVSDEYLEKIYAASSCLLAASEGEGFGLPLVEAAQHKLPIIARDMPVFREVAAEHAHYFSGLTSEALADAIKEWLMLYKADKHPHSDDMPWLTWKESTQQLLKVLLEGKWYQQWMPDGAYRYCGADSRLATRVGTRDGRDIVTTNKAGILLFGPYLPLPAGRYNVSVYGSMDVGSVCNARVDVAVEKGRRILIESPLASGDDGCLSSLMITLEQACTDLEVRILVGTEDVVRVSMICIKPCLANEELAACPSEQTGTIDIPIHDELATCPQEQTDAISGDPIQSLDVLGVTQDASPQEDVQTVTASDIKRKPKLKHNHNKINKNKKKRKR